MQFCQPKVCGISFIHSGIFLQFCAEKSQLVSYCTYLPWKNMFRKSWLRCELVYYFTIFFFMYLKGTTRFGNEYRYTVHIATAIYDIPSKDLSVVCLLLKLQQWKPLGTAENQCVWQAGKSIIILDQEKPPKLQMPRINFKLVKTKYSAVETKGWQKIFLLLFFTAFSTSNHRGQYLITDICREKYVRP